MVSATHLGVLRDGVLAWNRWREDNPEVEPDLSGLDLTGDAELVRALTEERQDGEYIADLDLRGANLQDAVLEDLSFYNVDFRGADLSRARLNHSKFVRGGFAVTVPEVEARRARNGRVLKSAAAEMRAAAATLEGAQAFGASFRIFSFNFADLTGIKFDEATRFRQVGVIGARITQARLQMLDDYGGLTPGRRAQMEILDDVATLRHSFGGFWNTLHVFSLVLFLAPYLWFIGEQWLRAGVGDQPVEGVATTTILLSLLHFIWSGGGTWRTWDLNLAAMMLFTLTILFNLLRVALVLKTKKLEHEQLVTGLHLDFQLRGRWKAYLGYYKLWRIPGLLIVAAHTVLFLLRPVPL